MKSEITDIAYSTALTFELVTHYDFQTLGAPTFPSLRKEAIYKSETNSNGVLLFIQYKLGDYFVGTGSSLKDTWGIPYYRFLVHPQKKIKRHQLLMNLESLNHLVYYTAPEFHTIGGTLRVADAEKRIKGLHVLVTTWDWSTARERKKYHCL